MVIRMTTHTIMDMSTGIRMITDMMTRMTTRMAHTATRTRL